MSASSTFDGSRSDSIARWLQILLVVSLSINLLIAGAVFGGAWVVRHRLAEPGAPMHGGPAMAMIGPVGKLLATLSPERRAELHDVIVQHQAAAADFNKSMTSARQQAADALLAVPFDRPKFEAALKHVYETEAAARLANLSSNGAVIERLSDAERTSFLKLLNWPGVAGSGKSADSAAGVKSP